MSMLNGYFALILTHRQVSIDALGQAKIKEPAQRDALTALKVYFGWEELLYLETCNRILYCFYTHHEVAADLPQQLLARTTPGLSEAQREHIASAMQLLQGGNAIRHILEVATGMDSMVLGEREIIRQLRQAYDACKAAELTGDHLRLLMRFTVETAKAVSQQTGIGQKALSVVALAFRAAVEAGLKPEQRILLVGAGQTNALVAKFLLKYGFRSVTVFNRTATKAKQVADTVGGRAFALDQLPEWKEGFDAIVVCTGAQESIITAELYQKLLQGDKASKIVIDLAVPCNVDLAVVQNFLMQYINVESLRDTAALNLAHREQARQEADLLLNDRIRMFREVWHQRQVERSLHPMVDAIKAVREKAINEVFAAEYQAMDASTREAVDAILAYMEKKCVAIPMRTVCEIARAKSMPQHSNVQR
jgi:glutamyl-tRNA reductase